MQLVPNFTLLCVLLARHSQC